MDPAVVAIVAALIGAGSSIVATALTIAWTGRHEAKRQSREEAAALRTEKRAAVEDLVEVAAVARERSIGPRLTTVGHAES